MAELSGHAPLARDAGRPREAVRTASVSELSSYMRRPLSIIEQDGTANGDPRLWISALYAKLTDH